MKRTLFTPLLLAFLVLGSGACTRFTFAANTHDLAALKKHAENDNAGSQYRLGLMYYRSDDVKKDYAKAGFRYCKAAARNYAVAEFLLDGPYHSGESVSQDPAQAIAWVKKAADQGYTDAEFFLATCYSIGLGVAKDDTRSTFWLRKAAEQGHFKSQFFLGRAYAAGIGVPADDSKAYFWLDIAASRAVTDSNREEVIERRDEVATRLSQSDLSKVKKREQKWHEDHHALRGPK